MPLEHNFIYYAHVQMYHILRLFLPIVWHEAMKPACFANFSSTWHVPRVY